MVDNKRGQQMTLGTIIAIVLGIAVLVFLIFGFSSGWNNLWDRVTAFGGGSNADTIVQACALRCSSGDSYGFCEEVRTVKYSDKTWEKGSCESLSGSKAKIPACDIDCTGRTIPGLTNQDSETEAE